MNTWRLSCKNYLTPNQYKKWLTWYRYILFQLLVLWQTFVLILLLSSMQRIKGGPKVIWSSSMKTQLQLRLPWCMLSCLDTTEVLTLNNKSIITIKYEINENKNVSGGMKTGLLLSAICFWKFTCGLFWVCHFYYFLRFWAALVSSVTGAYSPLCTQDRHGTDPPQMAASRRDKRRKESIMVDY